MNAKLPSLTSVTAALLLFLTGCCGTPDVPSVQFEIQAQPDTFSAPGQTITLAYTVRNPNQAMQVELVDQALGPVCDPFTLNTPDDVQTCTLHYTTTAADVAAGTLHVAAVARAAADGQGCATEPLTSETQASLDLPLVADASTGPLDPSSWPLLSAGCNVEATQVELFIDTGYAWLTPQARVVLSASDTETTYTCEVPELPGRVRCYGSQSAAPGPLTFCLQRETDSSPVCRTYEDFPGWLTGLSCQPDWALTTAGCDGATQIFFMIETGYDWLQPDGLYGFDATDGDSTYWCAASQTPGRVVCYGADPDAPGPLKFCFQRPEDTSPLCRTFPEFPDRLETFSCLPTPTPRPACSAITNAGTCNSTPGCYWPTSENVCKPTGPQ